MTTSLAQDPQAKLALNDRTPTESGPVECLGMTFENEAARRAYFLERLREKLQDPEFRQTPGFPKGDDEAILRMSDPPYYTACPNPFLADFVRLHGKPYDPDAHYDREPFAVDVSVGKTDPIYTAHSYHTKVPYLAIIPSILHYTAPGDIVLDAFCGSGQTGVAATMCGAASSTLRAKIEENIGDTVDWGTRHCILSDLAPAASFISHNYNHPPDLLSFSRIVGREIKEIEKLTNHYYDLEEHFNYAIWTDCFSCSQCASEIEFWNVAVNVESGQVSTSFLCPSCGAHLNKASLERIIEHHYDYSSRSVIQRGKYILSMINVGSGRQRNLRRPTAKEAELASSFDAITPNTWHPTDLMMFNEGSWGEMYRAGYHTGINRVHHFFTGRNLHALSLAWNRFQLLPLELRNAGRYVFTGTLQIASRMSQFRFDARNPANTAGGIMKGVLFVPSMSKEARVSDLLERRFEAIKRQYTSQPDWQQHSSVFVSTSSANYSGLPTNSVDYIFTDPPFGKNIMYSELNFLWEAWLQVFTNNHNEAIVSNFQEKGLPQYQRLMQSSFEELFRVLKPGRWMTVVFSNSLNSVWRAIQEAMGGAGFVVADIRTLDKTQRSFKQVTSSAVKQDLVISAYKPTEALAQRFELGQATPEAAWAFVKEHLGNVSIDAVVERTAQRLLDRMTAFHVQRGLSVPISGPDFIRGLAQRFPERDGLYFLSEQVVEYDRKRTTARELRQLSLFVSDEASAIQWVRQQLQDKPQSFQDLQPQFMRELQAWAKHEETVELKIILDQNFLHYDGHGSLPSQIHSYLSSNFKELRNLDKEDPQLIAKARDRWYVPDPNKQADLAQLRERALLKEFEEYKASTQRKLTVFRTEAVRAGFKACWQERDYATIVSIGDKLPGTIVLEDEQLPFYYDNARTRIGGSS